jgi:hypothetical protein
LSKDAKATADKQATDTQRSLAIARAAADAAAQEARASQATVAALERNAKRALRAYVAVAFSSISDYSQISRWTKFPITVFCQISNTGQTAAYGVAWLFRVEIHPSEFDPRTVLPLDPETAGGPRSRPMIAAHSHVHASFEGRQLTESELMEIRGDSLRVYILGTVTYRDLFKIARRTNFCAYMAIEGENASRAIPTEYGNDTEYGDND